jgi:hypothetical protein
MKRVEPAKGRFPKLLRTVFPALLVLVVGTGAILGYLVFRVTHPGVPEEPVTPSHYLLPWIDVSWTTNSGEEMTGWWITGMKGAPGIIVAPGYGMSRSDSLSFVFLLHGEGYHVLVTTPRGSEARHRRASSLGLREFEDMEAALAFLRLRPGVNLKRLGIWGADESARAALAAAAGHPEIRAIAVDTPYEYVLDFLTVRIREEFGISNWLIQGGCRGIFRLYHVMSLGRIGEPLPVQALADRSILFIKGANRKEMTPLVAALYDRVQPQKEMISLPSARSSAMSGEEAINYDRQVANFFHVNLSVGSGM